MTAIAHPDDAQAARRRRAQTASAWTGDTSTVGRHRPRAAWLRPFRLDPEDIEILPSEVARDLEYGRD